MEEKEVIAICNSGGVFHKAQDASLSYSGGNAQAICIHNQMTFDEFQIELAELFGRSSIGTMSIKYFIPRYSKTLISISNDKGLRSMIRIHRDSAAIELYIMTDEMLPLDVSNTQQCSRSSQTTLPEAMAPADASLNNAVDDTNATQELIAPVSGFGDTHHVESHIDIPIGVSPMMPRGEPNDAKLWKNSITCVGQTFNSVVELRESIRKYASAHQFAFRFKKNDSDRVIVECKTEGCPWGIHALRLPDAEQFRIKKMTSEHNCDKAAATTGHQATSSLVAGFIEEKLKVLPNYNYKIKDIVSDFNQEYGIKITYQQARRAKMIADGIEITNQQAWHAKKKAEKSQRKEQRRAKMKAIKDQRKECCRSPLLGEMITEEGEHRQTPLLGEMITEEGEHRQTPLLCEENITAELIAPVDGVGDTDYVESHIDRPIEISPMMPRGDCRSPLLGEMTVEEEEHRQSPRLCEMIMEEEEHRQSPRLCEMIIEEEEHRQSPRLCEMIIEEEEHRQSPLLGEMTIEEEEHRQTPLLYEMILEENPGSLATFTTKDDSTFPGRFLVFRSSLLGFQKGCRPLLFLDHKFLASKKLLLTASSIDGEARCLLIAFAVVDRETGKNWRHFLLQLKACLSISSTITFLAHIQLKELISNAFPGSYHSFWIEDLIGELFEELKKPISSDVKNQIERYYKNAWFATSPEDFHESLESIKGISSEAYNWISKIEPTNWVNALRYVAYTLVFRPYMHKVCEVVSSVSQLVDALGVWTMKLIIERRTASAQWTSVLIPSMEVGLEHQKWKAGYLDVLRSAGRTYEVRGVYLNKEMEEVDIDKRNCSCLEWQIKGIPCSHALAVIYSFDGNPYEYCSRYCTTVNYRLTYYF